jgi:hypothetical protein
MSTRKEVPHPARNKKQSKGKKKPTMDMEGKLMNRLYENEDKRKQLAASITNRNAFLHNTASNNMRNEVSRLYGIYQAGSQPCANDGRYRPLSQTQLDGIADRVNTLKNRINNAQPIIGNQANYQVV